MADPRFAAGVAHCDGAFVPVADARIPLLDWGFLRSDACQDTVSVWKGSFFRLADHVARFRRSYTRLRMTCPYDDARVAALAHEAVRLTGLRDAYVQLIMTRGRPPIGSRDVRLAENQFRLFCIPYVWIAPPAKQEEGLHLHVSAIRRVPRESVDPTVKHYHWLDFQMGLLEAYDRGADTVALVDADGNVTEGPGFNLFAVEGGTLATPASGCLDGMTRDTVMALCAETNLKVEERALAPADLARADEVFLTSTAGGIIPIARVDGAAVGPGMPGPVTLRLRALYWSKREAGWHGTKVEYGEG